ncbi:unnamed protein product [Moneuplotes crassus]|uniref:Uncharacterized protein n=1 Tax=Euplotes crassus TaxID=5936 RepID=A0AAD1XTW8_EUPCR|nr:unnamed protein product [Moneuplotes crassus]
MIHRRVSSTSTFFTVDQSSPPASPNVCLTPAKVNEVKTMNFRCKSTKSILTKLKQKDPRKSTKNRISNVKKRRETSTIPNERFGRYDSNGLEIDTDFKEFYFESQQQISKRRSTVQEPLVYQFLEGNPFGFTPYDSGKIIGNYNFKETDLKIFSEPDIDDQKSSVFLTSET